MRKIIFVLAVVFSSTVSLPAAVINFQLDGVLNSVSNGTPNNGQIVPAAVWTLDVSFDDAGLTGVGTESFSVSTTQGSLLGYTISTRNAQFEDGVFSSLTLQFLGITLENPFAYVLRSASPDDWTIETLDFNGRASTFHLVTSSYGQGGAPPQGRLFGSAPTETPEPSSVLLFGVGLLTLFRLRTRSS